MSADWYPIDVSRYFTLTRSYSMRIRFVGSWRGDLIALITLIGFWPMAHLELAGQETSASIVGQVKDESGAVLPGVTVTVSSPALQIAQTVSVTDERGEYRLTPLPIGTYQVEYSLSGFQLVRQQDVRLTVGFVAKLDQVMRVGTVEETITVSGASPVVDVRATATGTDLTREQLELTPTPRRTRRIQATLAWLAVHVRVFRDEDRRICYDRKRNGGHSSIQS
jgi:hypothetical protein